MILGDRINTNILGMVESIQAAPHMAFTIYMVEIDPYKYDNETITIYRRIVTNTFEVERSVVKITVYLEGKNYTIDSEVPEKGGKGSKPILSTEEFLERLTNKKFREIIENYWKNWEKSEVI